MDAQPATLCRLGAWGQLCTLTLAVGFWSFGIASALFASCLGYLVVTVVGIAGIARAESALVGPILFPFVIPGFVPLYYFATR